MAQFTLVTGSISQITPRPGFQRDFIFAYLVLGGSGGAGGISLLPSLASFDYQLGQDFFTARFVYPNTSSIFQLPLFAQARRSFLGHPQLSKS